MSEKNLRNYAIILASGTGSRFGSEIPKQFVEICGKTILEHSVEIFENNEQISGITVVITPQYLEKAVQILSKYKKINKIIPGGASRKESSYIGVNSIETPEANVLIHDCARPLLSQDALNNCIEALNIHQAVAVAKPATDTIIEVENNFIKNIPQRNKLMMVGTPQCFRLSLIKKAHELSKNDDNFTDDCGLIIKHALGKIFIVKGNNENIKITYLQDLVFAQDIISRRAI